jgi:formylglycine-generating enzyme required for sulfatase activity
VATPAPPPTDEIVWNTIKDAGHPAVFADFISKFSDSRFWASAEARRVELQRRSVEASAAAAPSTDEIVWNAIKDSSHQAVYEEFLAKFPTSKRAEAARSRAEEIKNQQVALLAQPAADAKQSMTDARIHLGLRPLSNVDEAALKPKSNFRECEKCPELVVVPKGSFMMGSPDTELRREATEGPQRLVTFAAPFAVGRFAVTFDEWETCVADGGCNGYRPWDNGWGRGKRPVINVSWHDAKSYVSWLSSRTGKPYRLLSEAEREYVARAGSTTPYWWGSTISRKNANFSEGAKGKAQAKKTHPVDSFQANAWGLYQVHGNVWEWIDDCMLDGFAGAPTDGLPRTKDPCDRRGLRGGSWISEASLLRSASRYGVPPEGRVSNVGFRVARTLSEAK